MAKAPNGQGSITKIKTGKHKGKYRVAVVVGWVNGKPRRKTGIFAKHSDADAFRKDTLEKGRAGKFGPLEFVTLETHLNEWLKSVVKPNRAETTFESYGYAIRNHIVPHLGSVRLLSLESRHIEVWSATLLENNIGARTRQNAFVVLSAALAHAVARGDLPINPCSRVEKPRAPREVIDPFTQSDVDRILEAVDGTRYAALFRVAFAHGLRQGELFGLESKNVDLEAGTIRVVSQAVEVGGGIVFREPKSKASIRTIPISERTRDALLEHRKRMLVEGRAGRRLEFVSPEGHVIRRSTFGQRVWRPLLKKLEIRHRGFHHARHSYATLMLGSGVALHVVSKLMGHSKPSVTADLYAHAIPDQVAEAQKAGQRLFG